MANKIKVVEARNWEESTNIELNPGLEQLPNEIKGPAIVINRHQRSTSFDDSYGFPKATFIDGYDEAGALVTTRSLYERESAVGKVWQSALEQWKIARVRFTVGRTAVGSTFETSST